MHRTLLYVSCIYSPYVFIANVQSILTYGSKHMKYAYYQVVEYSDFGNTCMLILSFNSNVFPYSKISIHEYWAQNKICLKLSCT